MFKKINILIFFLTVTGYLTAQTCNANFTYTVDTTTNTVSFADLSTLTDSLDYITSWIWSFGDGSIDSLQNVIHTYNIQGSYIVCLSIITAQGDSCSFCDSVNVSDYCAGFYVTANIIDESSFGASDGAIYTTVYGGTSPYNYMWNTGDTGVVISNLSAGNYCVTVTDSNACNIVECFDVFQAQNCHPNFTYTLDTTTNTVTFTDLSYVTDSSDYIISWYWIFGDGTSGSQQNETHIFNSIGGFLVCLTIASFNGGDTCTFCDSVFITNSINPCAGFYVTGIVTNESVSGAGDGAIDITVTGGTSPFNYIWNDSSTVEDLINLSAGQYCVTVTDFISCSYDTCFVVGVDNPVSCNASFSFSAGTCPNCFDFTDQSTGTGTIVDWHWDFGNGNYSTLQNPNQTFLDSGSFVVSLTILTSDSCSSTFTDTVYTTQSIQTFSVSGQVFADSSLLSSGTAQLFSDNFSASHPPFYSVQIQNGDYFFPEVASGNYKLLAIPDSPESDNFQATFFGDKADFANAYVLQVYSDLVSVDIHLQSTSNGIEETDNGQNKVFPNPAASDITFEVNSNNYDIVIFNFMGQQVRKISRITTRSYTMPKGDLKNGIYFYKIITNNEMIGSGKLILTK